MKSKNNSKKIYTNPLFVTLCALLCCALWGSATPFIKLGYEMILPVKNTSSTILFAGVRFIFAGVLTVLIYSIARRSFLHPKSSNWGRVFKVASFQTVIQYIFFYVGLANTTGVKGTIISGSSAFFAIFVSSLIFKMEKLTVKKIVACLIGFAGIVAVNLKGLDFNMNFTGDAFVLFSAVSLAVSSTLMKIYSKHEDPVVISGYQFIVGGLFMIVVGLIAGGAIVVDSVAAFGVLTYLSMLSAVAYALWGILLKYNPVSKVTIFSFMTPVFGVILSKIMLAESADVSLFNILVALALVCVGIFMLNYTKKTDESH